MIGPEIAEKAAAFEDFLGYRFIEKKLLCDAIVSRGYPNEHPEYKIGHRQRVLANMGDAVIDVLSTEHLIVREEVADEGRITTLRSKMVRGSNLNEFGQRVSPFIVLTSGEENDVGDSSIPGESLEALVGALYLDGGLPVAKRLLDLIGFFEKEYD
jgi:ribonuclease-3